jgi:hypothetical protein
MTTKQHLDRHDQQIAAIRDLVREGMRMVVETRRLTVETRKDLRALAAAQCKTEQNLQTLIAAIGRSTNGHAK